MLFTMNHILLLSVILSNELFFHSPSCLSSYVEQYNANYNGSKEDSHPSNNISLQSPCLNPVQKPDHDTQDTPDGKDEDESSNSDLLAVKRVIVLRHSFKMRFVCTYSSRVGIRFKLFRRLVVFFWRKFLVVHVYCFDGDLNQLLGLSNMFINKKNNYLFVTIFPDIFFIQNLGSQLCLFDQHQEQPNYKKNLISIPNQSQYKIIIKTLNKQQNNNTASMQKQPHTSNTQPTHSHHAHIHSHEHEYQNEQDEQQYGDDGRESQVAHWKLKQQRKKYRKAIFGQHYNYNYRKPNQYKMYRIQENRNTEIQRSNRILLQKIQSIFKRSMGRRRITEINTSEAASMSDMTNKTSQMAVQSQPHSTSNITSSQKRSIQEQLQRKMLNKGQKRSMNDNGYRIGSISKNIALAKNEVNYSHTHDIANNRQAHTNKNNIKLEELEAQAISRRKRIQTEISKVTPKNKVELNQKGRREKLEHQRESDEYYNPNINSNKKTSRKTITSNEHHSPKGNHKSNEHHNNKETNRPSSSKIILNRSTITLNNQPYRIELYVEGSTYIISSYCLKNGREFHELITMPYKHYQQLYKSKLNESHENIYQYLFINPTKGLLQVSGFESKFMDIFEYGQIQLNEISPRIKQKSQQKQKQVRKDSRISEEMSNVIVHYNNNNMNIDDTFDRITYVNSQFKHQKGGDLSSTPGPLTDQNKKIDSTNVKQARQDTSNRKQAIVMTDPILPQLKSTTPELHESKVEPFTTSQVKSRLIRKQQMLSSNLISLQIEPAKQTANKQEQNEKLGKQKLDPHKNIKQSGVGQDDSSIDMQSIPQKNPPMVSKKIYQPYQQEQYENIQIIQDNS